MGRYALRSDRYTDGFTNNAVFSDILIWKLD
jgi:hypothetical protein